MHIIATNYNGDCSWMLGHEYFIYDRTGLDERFDPKKIRRVENIGNADYDKLSYLVEFYDHLPDVFIWTKSNLFKYITPQEFEEVKNNKHFTPLLTQKHKTYLPTCYYKNGMYYELNDSWYTHVVPTKYFKTYNDFCDSLGIPTGNYIPFAPGGNYILTRESVHRHPKELYAKMKDMLPYTILPGEAHFCERSYYTLWGNS